MDLRWIDRIAKPNTARVPLVVGHCTRAREMASGIVRLLVFLKSAPASSREVLAKELEEPTPRRVHLSRVEPRNPCVFSLASQSGYGAGRSFMNACPTFGYM